MRKKLIKALFIFISVIRPEQEGSLDPTFNDTGVVITLIGDTCQANDLAIAMGGKIIVGGLASIGGVNQFALARYRSDGSLDFSFGSAGIVTTSLGTAASITSVALQSDGKIVVGGFATISGVDQFALARYRSDGSLDTSFNGTGIVTTSLGTADQINDIVIQPDGKIVAAGSATTGGSTQFALARYNTDGSPDVGFNGSGSIISPLGFSSAISGVALQSDNKIIIGGFIQATKLTQPEFAVARYTTDGILDTTFNAPDGFVTTSFATSSAIGGVAIQPDEKIIAAGFSRGIVSPITVARYTSDGTLDTTFNAPDGFVTTQIGNLSQALDVALQEDGKIVAVGSSFSGPFPQVVTRYNNAGPLDTTFNNTGIVTNEIGTFTQANGIKIQPDGKIVVVGFSTVNPDRFTITRFVGSPFCIVGDTLTKTICGKYISFCS